MTPFDDEDLLFHYTSAPIAVESILRTGELRLGQFAFTNDPRESRSWLMSASLPDDYDLPTEDFMKLSEEADGVLRRSVKLACFTQDDIPRDDLGGAGGRGFAHSSLWSHYGDGHRGVCLGFRRDLLDRFKSELSQQGDYFHGPVLYVDDPSPPYQATHVDIGQVEEFGLDAVLAVGIRENWKQLFFTKDKDWVTEREYRCVVLNQTPGPIYIDVSDHIRAVVLGDAFPLGQIATVHHVAETFENVEVVTIQYRNGRPLMLPSLVPRSGPTKWPGGALGQRRNGLPLWSRRRGRPGMLARKGPTPLRRPSNHCCSPWNRQQSNLRLLMTFESRCTSAGTLRFR